MQVFYTEHHTDLNSSALSDIWYDDIEWKLFVRFHNGAVAGYQNVPESVVEIFTTAPSVGRYYNESILGKFDGVDTKDIEFVERNLHFEQDVDGDDAFVVDAKESVVQDDYVDIKSLTNLVKEGIRDYVESPRMWEDKQPASQPRLFDDFGINGDDVATPELNAMAPVEDNNLSFEYAQAKEFVLTPRESFVFTVEVMAENEDEALNALHDGHYRVSSVTRHLR